MDTDNFYIVLGKEFKWDYNPPYWASVFLGSNDTIEFFDEIINQFNAYKQEELELVSVIGGMKFLSICGKLKFQRVTLFDKNINEIIKFLKILDYLKKKNYKEYDYFKGVYKDYLENPEKFYIPSKYSERIKIKPLPDFKFEYNKKKSSLFTLLDSNKFPEYQWKPTKKEFYQVKDNLNRLNRNFFLGLPKINAEGRTVILYLSHIEFLDVNFEDYIKNASTIFPIFAQTELFNNKSIKNIFLVFSKIPFAETLILKLVNSELKERYLQYTKKKRIREEHLKNLAPHKFWMDFIKKYRYGKTLHIWAVEDSKMVGGKFDESFDLSITFEDFLNKNKIIEANYNTCILHIILGKNKYHTLNKRKEFFIKTLKKASKVCDRIIITEHNKKCRQFSGYDLIDPEEILELSKKALSNFDFLVFRPIPGNGMPNRNIIIVAQKSEIYNDSLKKPKIVALKG